MHAGLGSLVLFFFSFAAVLKMATLKVTASSDGDIRVLQPTRKPTLISLLKVRLSTSTMLRSAIHVNYFISSLQDP